MGSLIQPGGPRRDQVVLRRTKPDLDRMSLDQAQLYLTTPPAGTGGGGVAGPYSVAASGMVTAVSGSTSTVSCNAPISKSVTATNYTGKVLNVNDLVFVTGIIDGATETYSVVSLYQGTGIPSFATPPFGSPDFPRVMSEWTSNFYFTAETYGMAICRLNDAYPQVMVVRSRGTNGTTDSSTLLWWDMVTSNSGTITTPLFQNALEVVGSNNNFSSPLIWPYGEGFAVFNGRGRSVYTDAAMYVWNPRAGGGVGNLVTINLPTESGYVQRSAGVGVDGKIWSATLTAASNFASATPSNGGAGPSELKLYRFDTVPGNIYSGSWTLVSTTSLPNFVGTTFSTGTQIQYGVFITHGGHLLVKGVFRTTSVSNHVGATARLSGSNPTVNTYTRLDGLEDTFWSTRFSMNADSLLGVSALTTSGLVQLQLRSPDGTTTSLQTQIPIAAGSPRAVFDQTGNIMVAAHNSTGGTTIGVGLYRSSQAGFTTPVRQSTAIFGTTSPNGFLMDFTIFGPVRAASGVSPKFVSLMPNGSGTVTSTQPFGSATEKPKYSFYVYEL